MKFAAVMLMLALTGAKPALSAKGQTKNGRQVTVYFTDLADVPYEMKVLSQSTASDMFASIGVRLQWRLGTAPTSQTDAIAMEFVTDTPARRLPGALGYALPYEGVHIGIFWDRIKVDPTPRRLLAHVMVHEITHILQGVARHSGEGIMKARWTERDQSAMMSKFLRFTPEDVKLIYDGIEARRAHKPKDGARMMTSTLVQIGVW